MLKSETEMGVNRDTIVLGTTYLIFNKKKVQQPYARLPLSLLMVMQIKDIPLASAKLGALLPPNEWTGLEKVLALSESASQFPEPSDKINSHFFSTTRFYCVWSYGKTCEYSYLSVAWRAKQQIKSLRATKRIQKTRIKDLKIRIQLCVAVHLGTMPLCHDLLKSWSRTFTYLNFCESLALLGVCCDEVAKDSELFSLWHLPALFH